MYKLVFTFIISIACFIQVSAQDTLPRLSVKSIINQIIISWKNNYGAKVSVINIQRSKDSLKNFITIGSVLNPLNKENGYVDHKVNTAPMFYRVFVAFEGGTYLFSAAHRPFIDTFYTVRNVRSTETSIVAKEEIQNSVAPESNVNLPSVILKEPVVQDSFDNFLPKVKIPKIVVPIGFVPSKYIFTNKENNLILHLPDAEILKYSLKFFDDKKLQILEIKKITEPYLLLEKVNFLHTGWFYYELFEDGIFLEKYKFYIGREGKFSPMQISRNGR